MTSLQNFFNSECKFIAGASSIEQIPNNLFMPEVAFIGRSNVGKSSLINAITRKRNCARVSKQPGRTQQINFFTIQDKISIVDLPGYGYAAVSKQTRKIWDKLILDYLKGRQNLRRVFMLIDARHGIKPNDEEIMNILDKSAVIYQIILTKVDKISSNVNPAKDIDNKIAQHTAAFPYFISTSSETKIGIQNIQTEIMSFIQGN